MSLEWTRPRARRFTTAGRPGSQSLLIKSILAGRSPGDTRTVQQWRSPLFFRRLASFLWAITGQDLAMEGIPWRAISSEFFRVAPTDVCSLWLVLDSTGPMGASAAKINTRSLPPSPSCCSMRYRREPQSAQTLRTCMLLRMPAL